MYIVFILTCVVCGGNIFVHKCLESNMQSPISPVYKRPKCVFCMCVTFTDVVPLPFYIYTG